MLMNLKIFLALIKIHSNYCIHVRDAIGHSISQKEKKKEYLETFYLAPKLYLNFCSFFIITLPKFILRLLFSQQRLISVLTSLP